VAEGEKTQVSNCFLQITQQTWRAFAALRILFSVCSRIAGLGIDLKGLFQKKTVKPHVFSTGNGTIRDDASITSDSMTGSHQANLNQMSPTRRPSLCLITPIMICLSMHISEYFTGF
jgi:hypothetical protein